MRDQTYLQARFKAELAWEKVVKLKELSTLKREIKDADRIQHL